MHQGPVLRITQQTSGDGKSRVRLRLILKDQADIEAESELDFKLSDAEQEELRWYLEDYLQQSETCQAVRVEQVESMMQSRGIELYEKVLAANQSIWFAIRNQMDELRIEINTGLIEAASIPWELMRDPQSDSAIAVRVKSFVRVQSNPNISFVKLPEAGCIRLLYIVCRPGGREDVPLRAVANRLLEGLRQNAAHFDITALRPPTFEQLQKELLDAKEAGRPYHIVHFDGHGGYGHFSEAQGGFGKLSSVSLRGKQGMLLFEWPGSEDNIRYVSGDEIGKLLHDNGVPILVLNACQSAMHDGDDSGKALGSLAQAVVDQGIPAVLGMRYNVFVVTAAQYMGELYEALAKGRSFGQAASEARKHLHSNPERWVGLNPRPLQDWFVPVIYEAMPIHLAGASQKNLMQSSLKPDPIQNDPLLRRHVPDHGFVGRDETLLLLDRAFDDHSIVLLHAYAGQGKSSTGVEFARWYAQTGGLGENPFVLFSSFETHADLTDLLNQIGQVFSDILEANNIAWHTLNKPNQRRELVFKLFRQIPLLWIWDNVEPVAGFPEGTESSWSKPEQTELADFLKQIKLDSATRVKLLLTSRRDEQSWLGGIPFRIVMPRMSHPDSADLALKLAAEQGVKRSPRENWQVLLDYCRGNPLTLRVLVRQAMKQGMHSKDAIDRFIQALREGELSIQDADQAQGRDHSLGASLDYGFKHAFKEDELPVIALLHLFQSVVDVRVLALMGKSDAALPELLGKSNLNGLMQRACEIGLINFIGSTWYGIHPALPWFLRQLFERHYDGLEGRSSSDTALQAWVKSIGAFGGYYHRQFNEGNRQVIRCLELEEANLLHARRLARKQGWWPSVISAMQGLQALYGYQGRRAEWGRLVDEIIPDYCSLEDKPVQGREDDYSTVMGYRVDLAREDKNLSYAAELQNKRVEWNRSQAASLLELPEETAWDEDQKNLIRNLAVGIFDLAYILMEQNKGECIELYKQSIRYARRINDKAAEAISHFNLGHAYKNIQTIQDLDKAEAAYRRSLDLRDIKDDLGRSGCIKQIGMVHYQRLLKALNNDESAETVLNLAQMTEACYLDALNLCPKDAVNDLGPLHNQLGNLYRHIGQIDKARAHYEKRIQLAERTGDRYGAGCTCFNLALLYEKASEADPTRKTGLLRIALAYAEAALCDYQHYQGRAIDAETKTQIIIDRIEQDLKGS